MFEGRAGSPTNDGQRHRYRFEVTRVWKGDVGARIDIYTSRSSASCGRRFLPGRPYVVYAYDAGGGRLGDNICSRTRTSAGATADLAALGVGRPAVVPEAPVDVDAPSTEPPRIDTDPDPPALQPTTPRSGRCTLPELPHDAAPPALVMLLAVAGRRRRA